MKENQLSYLIRGSIFRVYNNLGPGLLESIYTSALYYELKIRLSLDVEKEKPIPVYYKDTKLEIGFRADLLVNKKIIIEVKSVEFLKDVHHKQILTYLKLTDLKLGILVNFNVDCISDGIYRKVHNL